MSVPITRRAAKDVVITARGMVTSLGLDARASCAAALAGIVRPSDVPGFTVVSPEDNKTEPLVGHSIRTLTAGFSGNGRLLSVLEMGMRSLLRDAKATGGLAGLPLYVSVPDPLREFGGLELVLDEADRAERMSGRPSDDKAAKLRDERRRIVTRAADVALQGTAGDLRHVSFAGHTGVGECLDKALQDLDTGKASAVIVGGADTLLDDMTLDWLETTGRLKTPSAPVGLMPGEAAAFFVLECQRQRASPRLGVRVTAVSSADEESSLLNAGVPTGEALSEVTGELLGEEGTGSRVRPWLITDHNGELYRAIEWGNLLARLQARSSKMSAPRAWFPAASFGDTGAASAGLAIGIASHAFERGFAPAGDCYVVSSSDGSLRTAIKMAAPVS